MAVRIRPKRLKRVRRIDERVIEEGPLVQVHALHVRRPWSIVRALLPLPVGDWITTRGATRMDRGPSMMSDFKEGFQRSSDFPRSGSHIGDVRHSSWRLPGGLPVAGDLASDRDTLAAALQDRYHIERVLARGGYGDRLRRQRHPA